MHFEAKFHYNKNDEGLLLRLEKTEIIKKLFSNKEVISVIDFSNWELFCKSEVNLIISKIAAAIEEEKVKIIDNEVLLKHDFLASLNSQELNLLDLPPITKLIYEIEIRGVLGSDDSKIIGVWKNVVGDSKRVSLNGAIISYDLKEYIIPEPIYSLQKLINQSYDVSVSQQFDLVAQIKDIIGDNYFNNIKTDNYINRLKLRYASGFSLDVQDDNGNINFQPILFGRKNLDKSDNGKMLDAQDDSLLENEQQQMFINQYIRNNGDKSSYLLKDGTIIYIDNTIKEPLRAIRQAQKLPNQLRREFAVNPRKYISQAIGCEDDFLENIFVETKQYSERVIGLDIWKKPVIPWIKPQENSWLPEKIGLAIGNEPNQKLAEIPLNKIGEISDGFNYAVKEGSTSFIYDGVEFPVNSQTKEAIESLDGIASCKKSEITKEEIKQKLSGKYFLIVKENIEELEFKPIIEFDIANIKPPNFPKQIINPPKEHQIKGFEWLAKNWLHKSRGVLLADDMGLGKTFQIISLLYWLKSENKLAKPFLIVTPSGLIDNWKQEIRLHLPKDALGEIISACGKGLAALKTSKSSDISKGSAGLIVSLLENAGVVLTTYETMRDYHLSFAQIEFSAIIYDEAQKLKNPISQITRASKALNAKFQIAMTGTPVENSLQDLWSIFDIIQPGFLGSSRKFENTYNNGDNGNLKKLNEILTLENAGVPSKMLRRMKADCIDSLPKKIYCNLPLEMPPAQAEQYISVIKDAHIAKEGNNKGYMLKVLQDLRAVSMHPFSPSSYIGKEDYFALSAKLNGLFETLAKINNKNEKALIFCESLEMQDILAHEIKRRFGLPFEINKINGNIPSSKRQNIVNIFQNRGNGFDALILSPRAGGVGLTITAANHVIHLSRWWNPAVEDQATDRAFRIGQTKDVTVYIPQAIHPDPIIKPTSFDLKLAKLIENKRKLSQNFFLPENEEQDTQILIDGILDITSGYSNENIDNETTNNPEIINGERKKGILSLNIDDEYKRRLENKLYNSEKQASGEVKPHNDIPSYFKANSGERRCFDIFDKNIRGEAISIIEINDPYMMGSKDGILNIIKFIKYLLNKNIKIKKVILKYLDVNSLEHSYYLNNIQQENDVKSKFKYNFPNIELINKAESKRGNGDFHDREVRVTTISGRKLLWSLGRGLECLFNIKKECTIGFHEIHKSNQLLIDE